MKNQSKVLLIAVLAGLGFAALPAMAQIAPVDPQARRAQEQQQLQNQGLKTQLNNLQLQQNMQGDRARERQLYNTLPRNGAQPRIYTPPPPAHVVTPPAQALTAPSIPDVPAEA